MLVIWLDMGETVVFDAVADVYPGARVYGVAPELAVVCCDTTKACPLELPSTAIAPLPAAVDLSATQSCCVNGFTLSPLGSAPASGRRHS